jgi:hypothetical protein
VAAPWYEVLEPGERVWVDLRDEALLESVQLRLTESLIPRRPSTALVDPAHRFGEVAPDLAINLGRNEARESPTVCNQIAEGPATRPIRCDVHLLLW